MKKKMIFYGVILTLSLTCCAFAGEQRPLWPPVALKDDDRILILAPHPDDEVLGCAGIIQKAVSRRIPVKIVFFTNGDSNQWSFMVLKKHPVVMPKAVEKMGIARQNEALEAAKRLGVVPSQLAFLGYPDYGTLAIWRSHWGKSRAYRSLLTRTRDVPYRQAYRPGAAYKGEEILKDLTSIIKDFKPTKIFVSHAADHNGDHRSLYLFLRVALWDLAKEIQPRIYPYLIHYRGWPTFKERNSAYLEPPEDLKDQVSWQSNGLTSAEITIKQKALNAHKSQFQSSAKYLKLFIRSNEIFGDFVDIKIPRDDTPTMLSTKKASESPSDGEGLTDVEKSVFVGVEWRYVWIEGDYLVMSIELSRALAKGVESSIYIFGYRSDRVFSQMPKIHIRLGVLSYSVYDQNQRLPRKTIDVTRQAKIITIKVPLKVLGRPDRVLTSAQTYFGRVPLDWVTWRILEFPDTGG